MPREVNTSRGFFVSSLKVGKRVRVHNIYNSAPESLQRENSANRVSVHKFYISAPESRFKISPQKVLFFLDLPDPNPNLWDGSRPAECQAGMFPNPDLRRN